MTEFFQIIPFWLIVILYKAERYLYLWQVKEYRFDRMIAGLKEPRGTSVIFSKAFYGSAVLFFMFLFFENAFFVYVLFVFYAGESALFIYKMIRKRDKTSRTTLKSFSLFFLSVSSAIAIFLSIISPNPYALLLFVDILVPLIVTFWVLAFKPLSFLGKQIIVYRAKQKRKKMRDLIAIAITGSFGKTSVKEFSATILSQKYSVAKTREHQNTEIGAARAILSMPAHTQVLIAEEAAYKKGDIEEISAVVQPTIGIITAIGSQHLALFGSREAIVETKFELARALPEGGTLIVNWDNELIRSHLQLTTYNLQLLRYAIEDKEADIFASDIDESLEGSFFTIHYKNKSVRAEASLLGRHNVSNVLASSAAALELGMSLEEIAKAIATLKPFPRTLEPKQGIKGSLILDDTYNASFEGVLSALDALSLAKGKKILVFTSIIELGEMAKEVHKKIGEAIEKIADFAIITDERHKEELQSEKTMFIKDPQKVVEKITDEISSGSVILLEGRIPQIIIQNLCQVVKIRSLR